MSSLSSALVPSGDWTALEQHGSRRSCSLKEHDEQLVEVLLSQDAGANDRDSDAAANPFVIPGTTVLAPSGDSGEVSGGGGSQLSIAEIDARISDLALDHDWDVVTGSLSDFASLSSHPRAASSYAVPSTDGTGGSPGASCSGSAGSSHGGGAQGRTRSGSMASSEAPRGGGGGLPRFLLPAISECDAESTAGPHSASGGTMRSGAGCAMRPKASKHDTVDYLRPMREEHELLKRCELGRGCGQLRVAVDRWELTAVFVGLFSRGPKLIGEVNAAVWRDCDDDMVRHSLVSSCLALIISTAQHSIASRPMQPLWLAGPRATQAVAHPHRGHGANARGVRQLALGGRRSHWRRARACDEQAARAGPGAP